MAWATQSKSPGNCIRKAQGPSLSGVHSRRKTKTGLVAEFAVERVPSHCIANTYPLRFLSWSRFPYWEPRGAGSGVALSALVTSEVKNSATKGRVNQALAVAVLVHGHAPALLARAWLRPRSNACALFLAFFLSLNFISLASAFGRRIAIKN